MDQMQQHRHPDSEAKVRIGSGMKEESPCFCHLVTLTRT